MAPTPCPLSACNHPTEVNTQFSFQIFVLFTHILGCGLKSPPEEETQTQHV